ncbi:ribonucleoprotein PTB-binding 2 [Pimephales promelas]|uniref:ribonucleoprotein PTB-binding 2 n=1 Tax=Pimephales promelas TaxID=90988 RepID=UPI00195554E2|nr:ribonucleoprotein PTB-binding 2 [Pimephales promelas]KAG1941044.1 ribonucleoprotein PTB-binding [Pimephales promelas]
MAAASSIQPPSVHGIQRENSPHPESDSPASRQEEDAASEGITILRDLPELDPEEIEKRLEKTRRELSNRRKILIKNLPQDTTNQEVHEILREYELKYCFVDRNKGTAFVTLLNGDQAQDAIRTLHQTSIRGRDITVQLQPTDSLLCVTNLPYTVTAGQFQELVRSYGNIERCFLVYSDLTGHSKGYGFVEYMKKDSASRARSELLGKPLGDRALMVQWADVNQLTSAEHLHSKCLCVDRLPLDFEDSEELAHIFSESYKPVFCQLAQDEGSPVRGFAVVEYETAEQAEAMLLEMDRQLIQGQEIRLSLCPPGTSGRSTLAALIAAQGVMLSNKKGLLPEPNLAQFLNSMTNPAALQVLMRPYPNAKRGGKFGRPHNIPFLRPPLTAALLQLGKAQQSAILGNGLVLQNLLHMQMAQQQLLQIKDKQITNVQGLLGDPSRLLLQKVLGLRTQVPLGKGLLGDSPTELGQDSSPVTSQGGNSGAGMVSHIPGRSHASSVSEQNGVTATCLAPEKQPAPPGTAGGSLSSQTQLHNFLSGINTPLLGSTTHKAPANHHSLSVQTSTAVTSQSSCQTSLLGDPPKEVKLPSNPYLNLASVLPGVVLQAPCNSKPQTVQAHTGTYSAVLPPNTHPPSQYSTETTPAEYTQQYAQQYTQEAMQQWYQHYQAQTYGNTSQETAAVTECAKEQPQVVVTSSYGDYSSYMHAVNQYYSQTQMSQSAAQVYQHRDVSKEVEVVKTPLSAPLHTSLNGSAQTLLPTYSALPIMPGFITPTHTHTASPATHTPAVPTANDWNSYYYSQARGQKREYPTLPTQEVTSEYVGQHSQGLGGHYADYFKKKRI